MIQKETRLHFFCCARATRRQSQSKPSIAKPQPATEIPTPPSKAVSHLPGEHSPTRNIRLSPLNGQTVLLGHAQQCNGSINDCFSSDIGWAQKLIFGALKCRPWQKRFGASTGPTDTCETQGPGRCEESGPALLEGLQPEARCQSLEKLGWVPLQKWPSHSLSLAVRWPKMARRDGGPRMGPRTAQTRRRRF